MTQYDPNNPNTETVEVIRTVEPGYTETVETVVVRESNTGWWIAGILGALVLLAVLWILFARGGAPATDDALLDARLDAGLEPHRVRRERTDQHERTAAGGASRGNCCCCCCCCC